MVDYLIENYEVEKSILLIVSMLRVFRSLVIQVLFIEIWKRVLGDAYQETNSKMLATIIFSVPLRGSINIEESWQ
jgi:hypothetical protein